MKSSDILREAVYRSWSTPPVFELLQRLNGQTLRIAQEGLKLADEEPILRKEDVIAAVEEAGGEIVNRLLVPALQELIAEHNERWGWFAPPRLDSVDDALSSVRAGKTRRAARFLKASFPSYWQAGDNVHDWNPSDQRMSAALRFLLAGNDISFAEIRRSLRVRHHVVSFFQPAVAFSVYKQWVKLEATNPTVWDPSCGFGARLLAFAAAFPAGTYIGTEPASLVFRDLTALASQLPCKVDLRQEGSEKVNLEQNSLDFVFTSPPYFDREKYFLESSQSWLAYPTLSRWEHEFVRPTLHRAFAALKPGCFAAINVNQALEELFIQQGSGVGFVYFRRERLELAEHPFNRDSVTDSHEPLLIFQKPEA